MARGFPAIIGDGANGNEETKSHGRNWNNGVGVG